MASYNASMSVPSKRLQIDLELTLEKAITVIQQREAVCEQQVAIKEDRLKALQLLKAVGQKNQKGTEKQTSTIPQKRCT